MVPGRFHADQRRPGKLPIETLGLPRTMNQLLLLRFPSNRVHPTNLLPTRMKITSNNQHRRLLPKFLVLQPKNTDYANGAFVLIQSIFARFAKGGVFAFVLAHAPQKAGAPRNGMCTIASRSIASPLRSAGRNFHWASACMAFALSSGSMPLTSCMLSTVPSARITA